MDECKPLLTGPFDNELWGGAYDGVYLIKACGRGLHSFNSRLNLSAVHGIGVARRDCVSLLTGVFGGI